MISIDNPPVPDPSCSSQLNSSDERASQLPTSSTHKLPPSSLSEIVVVDLPNPNPNPSLDHPHHHTPLPNFSIRDHVFKARSKDIKNSWPFSLKTLQLCLKHGLKNVLPQFEPVDTVRNHSFKRLKGETSSVEKQNISERSNFDKEASRPDNHVVVDSSDDGLLHTKLAEFCVDISSCRYGEENDFPSTTTSEIDSVPDNRERRSPTETRTLAKAAVEVGAPVTHKTESTTRPLAKKCRLIVKFGGNSDRGSVEDIASNCTTISETMASKVCPVCKTFSSSSNTTLNAHIDQCLSVESTPKWAPDSKLTRYRFKPRKTRLMMDIYTTAQYCTLEELDRRNGTSWATMSSLPAQGTEKSDAPSGGKKQRMLPIHPEDAGDVGPVYIDANGTKVRILSQFNDTSPVADRSEDVGARREDIGANKSLKGGKASNYISKKKKKRLTQKHQKYLKLASQSKKVLFHEVPGSQISGGQEEGHGEGKSSEKEHQMLKKIKPSDCGTLRPWVCSKRRGFPKTIAAQESHQTVRCKWHLAQELLVENDQSSPLSERSRAQMPTNLCDNQMSSPRNSERMEKLFHKDQVNERRERSPVRKKVGNLLVGDRISGKVNKLFPPMKQNANQLSKDGTSIRDSCMLRPPDSPSNNISSLTKKMVYTDDDTSNNSDMSPIASTKSSRSSCAVVTKAMRFSPFRKSVLPVSSKVKRWSTLDKSQEALTREIDEEAVSRHSEVDEQYDLMQDHTENLLEREEITDEVSLGGSPIQEARQEKRFSSSSGMLEARSSSKSALVCGQVEGINVDSSARGDDNFVHKVDSLESPGTQVPVHEDIVVEPSSKTLDGRRCAAGMRKSVNSEFYELGISSKVQSNIRTIQDYGGLLSQNNVATGPTGPFVHDERMFSAAEAGNGVMSQDSDMEVGLDSDAAKVDFFSEVDPIPIPGPPGSFLPSPRDMGSEDFQGNSSLTTSRVHSSPDQHDVIDGDSSDSPLSALSTISNSMVGRSEINYSESPSSGHCVFQDKIGSGLMSAGIEPLARNLGAVPQAATTGVERTTFSGEHLKLDRISIEKESFGLKNDQPCCCQRKERFSGSVSLNHEESLLLRRRRMASLAAPSVRKQMGCNSNPTLNNLDVRPELVPLNSYSASGSEKMVVPLVNPPTDPIPLKDSPNSAGGRFLARADSDSASPCASNPILRLMGKNLMVVNKEDNASMPVGQPCAQNINRTSHFPTISAVSPGNIQNQDSHSFHHMAPRGSVIFSRDPYKTAVQRFDFVLSDSFGSHTDSKLPRAPSKLPEGMFCDQHSDGGFATSMKPHQCKEDYNFSSSQNRLKRRLDAFPTRTMQKATEIPDRYCKRADSSAHPVKEIIIIDDVPESETVVISDITKYNEGWRERQVVSSGISVPTISIYNTTNVKPFTCYQSQDHPPVGGTPVLHNGSFHASTTKLVNTSPVKWGCPPEGPGMLQMNHPFMAASNSSGHPTPASLYYSPSF